MYFIKNISPILLFWTLISLGFSCQNSSFGQRADSLFLVTDQLRVAYDLKRPNEKYFLPYVLEEISGLTYTENNTILTVDDESGKIYEYDPNKEKIIHSIKFHKNDDYEGIEIVGNKIYVLRSDGDLFRFKYSDKKETKSNKYETDLSRKNDTEGLGYDPMTNRLLIACKEEGEISDKNVKGRAFYAFDLDDKKLKKKPLFIIGPKELKKFWEANRDFDYDEKRIKFKPSAIAFHPITTDYYVLSSVGKMLVVVSRDGIIKATHPIAPRVLGQPEGICFAPNGDMYLSSEGEGDRGYMLKFEMKN